MDTPPASATPADYLGLKTELQNIAGIIEQYPDHLKQRAFELLITAYLGSAHSKEGVVSSAQDAPAVSNVPVNTDGQGEAKEDNTENEFSVVTGTEDGDVSATDLDERIEANLESSTNMLRRRIRLRTMSPMRWPTSA